MIRPLRTADVAFAHELSRGTRWNQTERDWLGYLRFEPRGCFLAEVEGRSVGTATTISYGDRLGWIGMVLVDPDRRRHGIGSTLLRHAISYLQERGIKSIKLDATSLGKRVYVPMGFREEYEVARFEGVAGAAAEPNQVSPLSGCDLAQVTLFDEEAFGVKRAAVLANLRERNSEWCFAVCGPSGVEGYLIAREGHEAVQVGPWVARSAGIAEQLLRALFEKIRGRRIFLDVPAPNQAGGELMVRHHFMMQRTFTRMYMGENLCPGHPECIYGTGGAEKG